MKPLNVISPVIDRYQSFNIPRVFCFHLLSVLDRPCLSPTNAETTVISPFDRASLMKLRWSQVCTAEKIWSAFTISSVAAKWSTWQYIMFISKSKECMPYLLVKTQMIFKSTLCVRYEITSRCLVHILQIKSENVQLAFFQKSAACQNFREWGLNDLERFQNT